MDPWLLSTILLRVLMIVIVGAVLGGAVALGRLWGSRKALRAQDKVDVRLRTIESALDQVARQVEATAIEIERVAEGQRFLTRVLGSGDAGVGSPGESRSAEQRASGLRPPS